MKNASSPRVMIQKLRSDSEPEPEPEPDASDVYRIDRVDGSLKIHAEFLAEYRCKKCAGLSKKERQSNCKDCKDQAQAKWEKAEDPFSKKVDPEDGVAKTYVDFQSCYGFGATDAWRHARPESGRNQRREFRDADALFSEEKDLVQASHYRNAWCQKQGGMSARDVEILTNVTFLTGAEIKQVELLFNTIVQDIKETDTKAEETVATAKISEGTAAERAPDRGHIQYVDRIATVDGKSQKVEVIALSTQQLRTYLPEFSLNMFFDRLVRVFSESGEQKLTLLELIDLYSALSPRASFKWKCKVMFCVFDFDEDDILDQRDLIQTIGRMVHGTHMTAAGTSANMMTEAATNIQKLYRGYRKRKNQVQTDQAGPHDIASSTAAQERQRHWGRKKKQAHDIKQPKTILEHFAGKLAEGCTTVQGDALDYAFFEHTMANFPYFVDNMSVTITQQKGLESALRHYHRDQSAVVSVRCQLCRKQESELNDDGDFERDSDSDDDAGNESPTSPGSPRFSTRLSSSPLANASPSGASSAPEDKVLEKIWQLAHPDYRGAIDSISSIEKRGRWIGLNRHTRKQMKKDDAIRMLRYMVPTKYGKLRSKEEAQAAVKEIMMRNRAGSPKGSSPLHLGSPHPHSPLVSSPGALQERLHRVGAGILEAAEGALEEVESTAHEIVHQKDFFDWFKELYCTEEYKMPVGERKQAFRNMIIAARAEMPDGSVKNEYRTEGKSLNQLRKMCEKISPSGVEMIEQKNFWSEGDPKGQETDSDEYVNWMVVIAHRLVHLVESWYSLSEMPSEGDADHHDGDNIEIFGDNLMQHGAVKAVCEKAWLAEWKWERAMKFTEFYSKVARVMYEKEQEHKKAQQQARREKAGKNTGNAGGLASPTSQQTESVHRDETDFRPSLEYLEHTLFKKWDDDNKEYGGGFFLKDLKTNLKDLLGVDEDNAAKIQHNRTSFSDEVSVLMHLIDPHGGHGKDAFVHTGDLARFFTMRPIDVTEKIAGVARYDLSRTSTGSKANTQFAATDGDKKKNKVKKEKKDEKKKKSKDKIISPVYAWNWAIFENRFAQFWQKLADGGNLATYHGRPTDQSNTELTSHCISLEKFAPFYISGCRYPFVSVPEDDTRQADDDTDQTEPLIDRDLPSSPNTSSPDASPDPEFTYASQVVNTKATTMFDASRRVLWKSSMKTAEQMWEQLDTNHSGWVSREEAKQLIGETASQYGYRFKQSRELFAAAWKQLQVISAATTLREHLTESVHRLKLLGFGEFGWESSEQLPHTPRRSRRKLHHNATHVDTEKSGGEGHWTLDGEILTEQEHEEMNSQWEELEALYSENLTRGETGFILAESHKLKKLEDSSKTGKQKAAMKTKDRALQELYKERKDLLRSILKLHDVKDSVSKVRENCATTEDNEKVEKFQKDAQVDMVVRKDAFLHWWKDQYWLVKEHTFKQLKLRGMWAQLDTTRDGFKVWKARAVLSVLWNVSEETYRKRTDFNRRFVSWWHDHDLDNTGFITLDQFSVWWVLQPDKILNRALFQTDRSGAVLRTRSGRTQPRDWSQTELHYNREIMDEFGAMLTEVPEDGVEEKDKREMELDKAMRDLDAQIQQLDQTIEERQKRATWKHVRQNVLKTDQAPFGVLSGGTRPPMLKTRLRLLGTVRTDELNALRDDWKDKTGMAKALHTVCFRVNVKKEKRLLRRSRAEEGAFEQDTSGQSIGEIFGDFQVHKHRICIDTFWIRDLRLWIKKHIVEAGRDLLKHDLDAIERKFGRGVAEILRRAYFMLNLNIALTLLWMGLVIVPRDYVEGGGGLWNSTKAVTSGLLFVQDGGERSLFYDGYSKQPINWMGIPLRLDLLYFVAIVGTPAVSLVAVLRSMGEKLNNVAQGNASLTVNLDPNAHGAATILGRYTFGRTLKQNEESMRQRLRKQLDQWLQSHAEERQMEEINTNWCLRIVYDTRLLVGFLATVALIIVYIMLLYWILTSDVTITLPMGGAIKLAFISELLITILDEVMAPVIGLIVKAEGHIRHNDELGQLLKRTFVTKIVQVIVILYESFSSAETTCPEAEYGAVFARLVLADTLITITLNYFDLYSVNHGIPLPNYYSTVRSFQHENDKKRMSMLGSRWFGCCSKKHTYENHIPGEVQGTDWEILWKPESTQSATKAGSDTAQSDAGSYVFVRTADYSDESKGEHERETTIMPPEVKEALSYTYRLQRRIVMPEPLSLEDRVRGETQEAARTTWWKRRKQRFGGNKDTQKAKRGQLTSDWATSVPMQRLTSGKIKRVSLGVCACMLIDAGYSTKKRMVASNLNPDELVDKMWKQRGHHRYKFKNPGQVKRARQQAAAERSKQGRTERPGAPRYGVRYEAFFELLIESESIDAMDAATEKEEPLSPKTSNGELEPEPEPEPETVPEPEPEPEPEAVKTNDETAKPYLVVLQDGILSYYRTRDPKKEFVDKMGDCEGISQEEYEEKFAKLCKRMARKQKLNAHRVLKEISKAKKKPRVEVWQFEAWWFENGAKLVAKQSVTGTMQTKQIHKVSKQEAPGQMPSIIVESSRRTLKLTRSGSGWFGRTRDEMAMESKGDGSLLNVWLELLDGARAPYTVPNWGKTLQDLSDGTGTDGGASKRNALRRKQLIRAAEEHVSAGHAFAEGPANTMLREIFDEFDVDGSGTLDKDEVRLLLQKLRALHQTADAEHRYHEARKKSEANPHNQELQNKAAEAQQEAQNVEDQKAKSLTSYEVEGYMKQMELEQSQDGKVEFNEFAEWWNGASDGAKALEKDVWESRHLHACEQYDQAIAIYDQLLRPLRNTGDESDQQGKPPKRKKLQKKPLPGASGMSIIDEAAVEAANIDGKNVEEAREQKSVLQDELAEWKVPQGGTLDLDDPEMMKDLEVLLGRMRVLQACKAAEAALTKHTRQRDFRGQMVEGRKAIDRPKALFAYESALDEDESNLHLQRKQEMLSRRVNRASRKLTKRQLLDFTTELVKHEGEWEEVTTEVEEQRMWKAGATKLGSRLSAELLMSMLYRQSLIWVGTAWCPWLPLIGVITQYFIGISLKDAIMGSKRFPKAAYRVSGAEWAASETYKTFMSLSLIMLLVCMLPILFWLNQEPTCGPHNAGPVKLPDGTCADGLPGGLLDGQCEGTDAKVFSTIGVYLDWLETRPMEDGETNAFSGFVSGVGGFLLNPPVLLIMLLVTHTQNRYYKAAYSGLKTQYTEDLAAAARKEKILTEEVRLERKNGAEERASTMTKSGATGGKTPEQMREAQLLNLRKCFKALDADLKEQQIGINREMSAEMKKALDEQVKLMDKSGTLKSLKGRGVSACQAEAHQALTANAGATEGEYGASQFVLDLFATSTVLIRNIDAEFARLPVITKVVTEQTGKTELLACTTKRIHSLFHTHAHNASDDETYDRSVFPAYPHDSWAIVTFVHAAAAERMVRDFSLEESTTRPGGLELDPAKQPFLGDWHVIPWKDATVMINATLKVHQDKWQQARDEVIRAKERDDKDGETAEEKIENEKLRRTAQFKSDRYELTRTMAQDMEGMIGNISGAGAANSLDSVLIRKHNAILKTTLDAALKGNHNLLAEATGKTVGSGSKGSSWNVMSSSRNLAQSTEEEEEAEEAEEAEEDEDEEDEDEEEAEDEATEAAEEEDEAVDSDTSTFDVESNGRNGQRRSKASRWKGKMLPGGAGGARGRATGEGATDRDIFDAETQNPLAQMQTGTFDEEPGGHGSLTNAAGSSPSSTPSGEL